MATVKFRFISDPTFNDYAGTIQFTNGVCEIDEGDYAKLKELERFKTINGWVFEKIGGDPVPEKPNKSSSKRKSRKKKKKKKPATIVKKAGGAMSIKEAADFVADLPLPNSNPKLFENEKMGSFDIETEEKIEQTENQPEHDDSRRGGDTREDDPLSKTDS